MALRVWVCIFGRIRDEESGSSEVVTHAIPHSWHVNTPLVVRGMGEGEGDARSGG